MVSDEHSYLFAVCQRGVETALKLEVAREWPDFRFSYSRPGFVTFRLPPNASITSSFDLRSTFARTYGTSLGRVVGDNAEVLADEVWSRVGDRHVDHLHAWQRDARVPGDRGFEPGVTPLAETVARTIAARQPEAVDGESRIAVNQKSHRGQTVLDCVIVEPNEWWFGYHASASVPSRFPGGVCVADPPSSIISRANWKMQEALTWSQLPIEKGDRFVEIGSAPGGSCQALLDRGLTVLGIDPAKMDEELSNHPDFTHFRMRAADIKRRELQGVRWLSIDTNVAPNHTLETLESLVTHARVRIRGMLITLKFSDWELAASIPDYLKHIRSWGYEYVRARQLAFNRQEICVAAMRLRSMRRRPPWKQQLRNANRGQTDENAG